MVVQADVSSQDRDGGERGRAGKAEAKDAETGWGEPATFPRLSS